MAKWVTIYVLGHIAFIHAQCLCHQRAVAQWRVHLQVEMCDGERIRRASATAAPAAHEWPTPRAFQSEDRLHSPSRQHEQFMNSLRSYHSLRLRLPRLKLRERNTPWATLVTFDPPAFGPGAAAEASSSSSKGTEQPKTCTGSTASFA